MSLRIIQDDITSVRADAVVISAEREPVCGTGMDKRIYDAADSGRLLTAREKIGVIEPGNADITRSYGLRSRYVIHTVVPTWQGGGCGELETLQSCYRESLRLALKSMCRTVAVLLFPDDSAGYPGDKVLETAISCFREFLDEHEMEILFSVPNADSIAFSEAPVAELERYVRSRLREEAAEKESSWSADVMAEESDACEGSPYEFDLPDAGPASGFYEDAGECSDEIEEQETPCYAPDSARKKRMLESASYSPSPGRNRGSRRGYGSVAEALPGLTSRRDKAGASQSSLSYVMTHVGENFREMLLRLIDEKGLSDPYVYKKANLDRKLFSKIRCNPDYCPSRKTVIALAIALELTLDETSDLLSRAGYAFSPGSKADLIVEFCILNKIYDIFEVNMLLFKYGQPTLS